jgi:two-component sensor histidine kinase
MESSVTLPPDLEGLAAARALADQTTAPAGLVEAIRVVIAELASNAVHHARTSYTVTVREDRQGSVTVAVHDDSPVQPELRPFDPTAVRGRGLQIVEGLTEQWGTLADPDDGKTVWARLAAETA